MTTTPPARQLTDREREILTLAAKELTNAEIGVLLNITEHTVKTLLSSAYGKLDAKTRLGGALAAIRLGQITVPGLVAADQNHAAAVARIRAAHLDLAGDRHRPNCWACADIALLAGGSPPGIPHQRAEAAS